MNLISLRSGRELELSDKLEFVQRIRGGKIESFIPYCRMKECPCYDTYKFQCPNYDELVKNEN